MITNKCILAIFFFFSAISCNDVILAFAPTTRSTGSTSSLTRSLQVGKLHRMRLLGTMQTSDPPPAEKSNSTMNIPLQQNIQIGPPPDPRDDGDDLETDLVPLLRIVEAEIVYSIENEVGLKDFVKIINEKDRGIIPETEFDLEQTIQLLSSKALDTIEDLALMFRRKMAESKTLDHPLDANALGEWNDPTQTHKPRILVIGSGWGSHAFIKCIDTELYRVLVVSPTNFFVFTPMLASSSVGTTEIRSIVESTRDSNPTVRFLEGKGLDMNTEAKTIRVKLGEGDVLVEGGLDDKDSEIIEIPYDVAVYSAGVGPISSSSRTPGLSKENVYFLKSVNDARRLRSGVIDLLEKASQPNLSDEERRKLLTFVVVGGGPTGVEYCGELTDFLNDVTGKENKKNRSVVKRAVAPFASLAKYTKVILLQGGKYLLPMFDENLRESAKAGLQHEGVVVMTSTRVARIEDKEKIVIATQEGNEEEIDCGIIVWAAGTMPVRLTENLISNLDEASTDKGLGIMPSLLAERGRIPVDCWQRVLGAPPGSLLAIGDASGTVTDKASHLPQNAQVAAQQGAYIARLLNRGYDLSGSASDMTGVDASSGEDSLFLPPPIHHKASAGDKLTNLKLRGQVTAKPFQFLNLGQLAYTGGGEALSQVQLGDKKLFSQAGSVGFLLWRSVYIVKQVSTKTRILVLFDWAKTKIFGRDVTRN